MSDFKISPKEWNIDGRLYKPGDRLILEGNRSEIQFTGLRGTAENPIMVTALQPVVVKAITPGGRVMNFMNCQYIRLTGDPLGAGAFNIEITGGGQAIDFRELSSDVEIDHVRIHHVGYSGINIKTDPTCDPKTWRGNFTLKNVSVHDNIIEDLTDGEGIYIGESHYHQTFPLKNCSSGVTSAKEHDVENVSVIRNVIRRVGADGIQVGAAIKGAVISGNTVEDFGKKGVYGQSSGIQANPGTVAVIENNEIIKGTSFGIILQGRMGTVVRNNRVVGTVGGIMTVARENDAGTFTVERNTFQDITGTGVEAYSNTIFQNNVLQMRSGTLFKKYGGTLTDKSNSVLVGDSSALKLDASGVPLADSPITAGVGWKDYVKPAPKITKEVGAVELITTDGIEEWYLTTSSGKRKKIE